MGKIDECCPVSLLKGKTPSRCPFSLLEGQTCFSDEQLALFRKKLLKKRESAVESFLVEKSNFTHSDSNGVQDTSPTIKPLEDVSDTYSKDVSGKLATNQKRLIFEIDAALVRIEQKTYGYSSDGRLIPLDRLWSIPWTTTCD